MLKCISEDDLDTLAEGDIIYVKIGNELQEYLFLDIEVSSTRDTNNRISVLVETIKNSTQMLIKFDLYDFYIRRG